MSKKASAKEKVMKATAKPEKKGGKVAKASGKAAAAAPDEEAPVVDQDEIEEAEDEAASGGGGGGDAAALAAAGSGEMSASFKNFRHHPDMENFYRFIFENDLRHEALAIIDTIMVDKQARKVMKGGKSAH